MATPAQKTANQANATASSGPRSPAGRESSSMNSTTHGLTAKKALLPGLAHRIKASIAKWTGFYKPQTPVEDELLVEMATASVQRARAVELHCEEADRLEIEAPLQFDKDRKAEVAQAARLLDTEPEEATSKLHDSSQGCEWLMGRWDRLRFIVSLGDAGRMSPEDQREFLHLQGLQAGSRKLKESHDGQTTIRILNELYPDGVDPETEAKLELGLGEGRDVEAGRAWLMGLIEDYTKELKGLADLLRDHVDVPARQMAASRALAAKGSLGEKYARYERYHQNAFHKAYGRFRKEREQTGNVERQPAVWTEEPGPTVRNEPNPAGAMEVTSPQIMASGTAADDLEPLPGEPFPAFWERYQQALLCPRPAA